MHRGTLKGKQTININKISRKYLNPKLIVAKQLDVNTLIDRLPKYNTQQNITKIKNLKFEDYNLVSNNDMLNNQNVQDSHDDILDINNIVNNNISSKYRIVKYIGNGINGKLYLAKDRDNKLYICKKIGLNTKTNNNNQIEFELNILKYLSNNETTREYINPCLEHKVVANNIFTIFPVFDGYSIGNLKNYLIKLNRDAYYKIIFYLIKNILDGLAVIHKSNIAHQNLTDNSILVSIVNRDIENLSNDVNKYVDDKKYDLPIKFTDFGLGCGIYKNFHSKSNINDIFFNKCNANQTPIRITKKLLDTLKLSDYLTLSQKYDIFCLGVILLKLLLPNEDININLDRGYTSSIEKGIINKIKKKYLKNFNVNLDTNNTVINTAINTVTNPANSIKNDINKYKYVPIDVNIKLKRDIVEYLNIIIKNMISKIKYREPCQYVLDKIIIYEKYKNDIF